MVTPAPQVKRVPKPRRLKAREDTKKFSPRRRGQPSTLLAAKRPTARTQKRKMQEARDHRLLVFSFLCSRERAYGARRRLPRSPLTQPAEKCMFSPCVSASP